MVQAKRIDEFDTLTTPTGDEYLLVQDPNTLGYFKASASSIGGSSQVSSVNGQTGVVVLNADDISDTSTTNKFTTSSEKTKLAGIETGAQVNTVNAADIADFETTAELNARDAANRSRSNHTGTQTASTISDFTEATQDVLGSSIVAGSNVTVTYDDAAGTTTIASTGGGGGGATNLAAILSATNTVITSDTGTDATIPAVDATNAGVMTPTQKTKLDGIAAEATSNNTDTFLLDRANHTGSQAAVTISDFNTAADARITAAVGVSVQAYDANLTAFAAKTAPTGAVVGTTDTQTLTKKTLTAPSMTSPDITDGTINASGVKAVQVQAQVGAVNYPVLESSAAGSPTTIGAAGTDTNITLQLSPKGSGAVRAESTNGFELKGSASAPTAPPSGYARIVGAGSTTVRPRYINNSGTLETIQTSHVSYNPYKFSVYRSTDSTLAAGTDSKIGFDTKLFDTSSNLDLTSNRFIAPVAGFYQFNAVVHIASSASGHNLQLRTNGALTTILQESPSTTGTLGMAGSWLYSLSAGDYVELYAWNSAGSTRTYYGGLFRTAFSGFLVSTL